VETVDRTWHSFFDTLLSLLGKGSSVWSLCWSRPIGVRTSALTGRSFPSSLLRWIRIPHCCRSRSGLLPFLFVPDWFLPGQNSGGISVICDFKERVWGSCAHWFSDILNRCVFQAVSFIDAAQINSEVWFLGGLLSLLHTFSSKERVVSSHWLVILLNMPYLRIQSSDLIQNLVFITKLLEWCLKSCLLDIPFFSLQHYFRLSQLVSTWFEPLIIFLHVLVFLWKLL